MTTAAPPLDSALRQAERTLRKPSSAVWLRGVCVRTARFDQALDFYVNALGLTLGGLSAHPLTAQARAQLLDAEGRQVLDLVESDEAQAPGVHELAFAVPRRVLTLLRARLDLQGVAYEPAGAGLSLRDVDGTVLRVEAL